MFSKNQAKRIKALARKKGRQETGLFVAEGSKLVLELLKSSLEVKEIWALEDWLEGHQKSLAGLSSASVIAVKPNEMERLTLLTHPSPVLALRFTQTKT